MSSEKSYILNLNKDLGWTLSSEEGTHAWLERLARIMELPPFDGTGPTPAKVTFVRGRAGSERSGETVGPANPELIDRLRSQGWPATELTFVVVWHHPATSDIYCELLNSQNRYLETMMMAQSLFPFYRGVTERGGMPLHSALVESEGAGILLVGRGGIGKSTCCRRLPSHWSVLCDDETLIVRDGPDGYIAHPFPTWGDYLMNRSSGTWNVSKGVPLSAVFFLGRSGIDSALPVGAGEAAVLLNQSAGQVCARQTDKLDDAMRKDWRKSLFENASTLTRSLPTFRLMVSPQGKFWREIEKVVQRLS